MCFSQGLPSHTQNSNKDITSKVSVTLCIPGLRSWDSFSNAPMLSKFRDILIFKNRIIIEFCTVHGSAAVVEYFKLAATHSLHSNHNKKNRLIQLGMSYECLCDTGLRCWKNVYRAEPQIAKFMGPTWGPPGSCRPRWGPYWSHEPCYQGPRNISQFFIGTYRQEQYQQTEVYMTGNHCVWAKDMYFVVQLLHAKTWDFPRR